VATRALDQKAATMGKRLQDETALVTGATSNIGCALVTGFAAEANVLSSAGAVGSAHRGYRSDPRGGRADLIAGDLDGRGLHSSTSDRDDGHPGGVMLRGVPALGANERELRRHRKAPLPSISPATKPHSYMDRH
jgi:hypothetical protein